ncbi:MAG: CDGSH iron-sulfur domain-containing protein [Gammaproteobacteria bacterium]|nr:CDGSH iron-sulfur domain-containing protein [Gammaproteobacteria bacterium]MCW8988735.1 CDGSH iron-sulfur domain-containing protein [Gammaproteobacteria bacterium]MCW9030822.1 CDGSH iron-sulfur domain-containing protein [Gammaproteobacteria bacterium]
MSNSLNPSIPDSPQQAPYPVELEPGNYWWCACGKAKNQPFCDGSHQDTDFEPLKFNIAAKNTYHLCGCKKTKNPPYCDGSHNK